MSFRFVGCIGQVFQRIWDSHRRIVASVAFFIAGIAPRLSYLRAAAIVVIVIVVMVMAPAAAAIIGRGIVRVVKIVEGGV